VGAFEAIGEPATTLYARHGTALGVGARLRATTGVPSSTMSANIWAPVVAALGASLLTAYGTYGIDRLREGRQAKAAATATRRSAYARLLNSSSDLILSSDALRVAAEFRSGFGEGLDVATRLRKPVEPLEIADRLHARLSAVLDAVHDVWLSGSPEAIVLANQLSAEAAVLIGVPIGEPPSRWRRSFTAHTPPPSRCSADRNTSPVSATWGGSWRTLRGARLGLRPSTW